MTSRIWFTAAQKAELWEERANCCGHLAGAGKADRGTPWRDRASAAPKSLGSIKALRNAKRFPVALRWAGRSGRSPRASEVAPNVQVYFCDPRSPWQRGSNENTNGLLRQYFPRGIDFSRISQSYLDAIALRLNQRQRKTLEV